MSDSDLRDDPYKAYRFLVEIDGIIHAGFTEVSGLSIETEVETRREGGLNNLVYHFAKGTKYSNIVLKKGLTDEIQFWKWYQGVINGHIERKNGSIIILDDEGYEAKSWNFSGAYPVKWEGAPFNATSSSVVIESIVLVHRGITIDT